MLVHGAFADSSSWDGVAAKLIADGYPAIGAANPLRSVKGLVYVAAFAPEAGETVAGLAGKFPGSTLGTALAQPAALPDGGKDLYIDQTKFRSQFAADVPAAKARLMAEAQRR